MDIKRLFYGAIQRILKLSFTSRKNNVNVFMFHDVCPGQPADPELDIQAGSFEAFIKRSLESGMTFVRAGEILAETEKKTGLLTFDDVRENVYLHALPVLRCLNVPFVLFVSPSFIGREGYLTEVQLKELAADPLCEIGFHSRSHVLMRPLANENVAKEIDCSDFERESGVKCEYFAYPYGSVYACSRKNIDAVKESGRYKAAFGTVNSSANSRVIEKNRFYIPRLTVSDRTWERLVP